MSVADTVTFAGFADTNGYDADELNITHTIVSIGRDSYTCTVAGGGHDAAITAGNGGGSACQATQGLAWNTIHPIIQRVVLPDTTQTWTIQDTAEGNATTIAATEYAITANEDYTPTAKKVIKSGATHTVQLNGTFSTTNSYLSPVIDMERCSLITISNRIDNVTSGETAATGGANLAKYLTKTVQLNDNSDTIKIYLDVNRPNGSFVDLYYKSGNTAGTFNEGLWVAATPSSNNGVVEYSDGTTYAETIWDITPAATFTIFAIKIVMRSTGTNIIPKMQALRAIALRV
jgi:hypothetical protein